MKSYPQGREDVYGSRLLVPHGEVLVRKGAMLGFRGPGRGARSCGGHLGGYGPLTLQFQLVSVKGLLSTIFKVIARMVLR
jgi:hypothetical protein